MSRKKPLHPGIILKELYLDEMELTQADLAQKIGCKYAKVNEIINSKRGITPDFALDLEGVLGVDAVVWLTLQAKYDLWKAREKKKIAA